jgi:hypothetical protein
MNFLINACASAAIAFAAWASWRFMFGDVVLSLLKGIHQTPLEEAAFMAPLTGIAIALLLSGRTQEGESTQTPSSPASERTRAES